jgi:DNA-binding NtrC family response regulator
MLPITPEGPRVADDKVPPDVLIVEDDPLIVLDVSDVVIDLGVSSVRTAVSVEAAMRAIAACVPAFALLDVRLGGGDSFAVADRLAELNVPFAFVTGYRDASMFPARFSQRPTVTKPYSREALLDLLVRWRVPATVPQGRTG